MGFILVRVRGLTGGFVDQKEDEGRIGKEEVVKPRRGVVDMEDSGSDEL